MTTTFQIPEITTLLQHLSSDELEGRKLNYYDYFDFLHQLYQYVPLRTVEPLLPLLLSFKREPLTLKDHFVFSPLFTIDRSRSTIPMAIRTIKTSSPCFSSTRRTRRHTIT